MQIPRAAVDFFWRNAIPRLPNNYINKQIMKLFCTVIALCVLCDRPAWSQTPVSVNPNSAGAVSAAASLGTVTVNPGNGEGRFALIGVQPNQVIPVALQYPAGNAGRAIQVSALDGGRLLSSPGSAASDSSFKIQYQVGDDVGLYRVALTDGQRVVVLQFWVLDSQNAQRNPGCITAANPDY